MAGFACFEFLRFLRDAEVVGPVQKGRAQNCAPNGPFEASNGTFGRALSVKEDPFLALFWPFCAVFYILHEWRTRSRKHEIPHVAMSRENPFCLWLPGPSVGPGHKTQLSDAKNGFGRHSTHRFLVPAQNRATPSGPIPGSYGVPFLPKFHFFLFVFGKLHSRGHGCPKTNFFFSSSIFSRPNPPPSSF